MKKNEKGFCNTHFFLLLHRNLMRLRSEYEQDSRKRIKSFCFCLMQIFLYSKAPPHVLEYFMGKKNEKRKKNFSHFVATLFYVFSSRSCSNIGSVLVWLCVNQCPYIQHTLEWNGDSTLIIYSYLFLSLSLVHSLQKKTFYAGPHSHDFPPSSSSSYTFFTFFLGVLETLFHFWRRLARKFKPIK